MSETMISNQPMDEIARLSLAAREALTNSMVERIATTGAAALELVDRLNDEQTSAAVHKVLDRLTEAHKLGALDTLFDLVTLLHAARDAATDNILDRLFTFFEQMINTVGNEEMGMLAGECPHRPRRGGGGNGEKPAAQRTDAHAVDAVETGDAAWPRLPD